MSTSEIRRLLGVGFLGGLVYACSAAAPQATFEATPGLTVPQTFKVTPSSVLVFKAPPQAAYVALGNITLEWQGKADDEAVLRLVREKAAEVGANAVLYLDGSGISSIGLGHNWDSPPAAAVSATRNVRHIYTFSALHLSPQPQPQPKT
jgi:hypothetical protein